MRKNEVGYSFKNKKKTQRNTKGNTCFVPSLRYLVWQGFPGHVFCDDIDLKLCLHLFQDALAFLVVQKAGHSWSVYCDGSGADRRDHTLQHLLSHLTSDSLAMDLSGTLKKEKKDEREKR